MCITYESCTDWHHPAASTMQPGGHSFVRAAGGPQLVVLAPQLSRRAKPDTDAVSATTAAGPGQSAAVLRKSSIKSLVPEGPCTSIGSTVTVTVSFCQLLQLRPRPGFGNG